LNKRLIWYLLSDSVLTIVANMPLNRSIT